MKMKLNILKIFSLVIKLKDILFEIFVFDSNNIGSDKVLNIFEELEKKFVFKKKIIYLY